VDTCYIVPVFQHRLTVNEGSRGDDARNFGHFLHHRGMVAHPASVFHHDDMGIDPQNLGAQISFKTVHYGDDDDQGRDAQKDPGNRDKGDDGNEDLFPSGSEVAQTDEES